jgi:hypothetical protein
LCDVASNRTICLPVLTLKYVFITSHDLSSHMSQPSRAVARRCAILHNDRTHPYYPRNRVLVFEHEPKKQDVVRRPAITPSTGVRVFLSVISDHKMMSASRQPIVIKSYDLVRRRTTYHNDSTIPYDSRNRSQVFEYEKKSKTSSNGL